MAESTDMKWMKPASGILPSRYPFLKHFKGQPAGSEATELKVIRDFFAGVVASQLTSGSVIKTPFKYLDDKAVSWTPTGPASDLRFSTDSSRPWQGTDQSGNPDFELERATLFITDLAVLMDEMYERLRTHYASAFPPADTILREAFSPKLTEVAIDAEGIHDKLLWAKQTQILAMAANVVLALDIIEDRKDVEKTFALIEPVVAYVNDHSSLTDLSTAWQNAVRPLLNALQATPLSKDFVAVTTNSQLSVSGLTLPALFKLTDVLFLVHNHFVNLTRDKIKADKTALAKLDAKHQVFDPDALDQFRFQDRSSSGGNGKIADDESVSANSIAFFDEVFTQLGLKVEAAAAAAEGEAAADESGGGETPPAEEIITTTADDALKATADKWRSLLDAALLALFDQLVADNIDLATNPLDPATLAAFQTTFVAKTKRLLNQPIVDALNATISELGQNLNSQPFTTTTIIPDQGEQISVTLGEPFWAWVQPQLDQSITAFLATQEKTLADIWAQSDQPEPETEEDEEKEKAAAEEAARQAAAAAATTPSGTSTAAPSTPTPAPAPSAAGIPANTFAALLAAYRAAHPDLGETTTTQPDAWTWWKNLSLDQRRAFFYSEQARRVSMPRVVGQLARNILQNELNALGLPFDDQILRQPFFRDLYQDYYKLVEITLADANLDLNQLLLLKSDLESGNIQLLNQWTALQALLASSVESRRAVLIQEVQTVLAARKAAIVAELQKRGFKFRPSDVDNINHALDTLIIIANDPQAVINKLSHKDLVEYFNLAEVPDFDENTPEGKAQLEFFRTQLQEYVVYREYEIVVYEWIDSGEELEYTWEKEAQPSRNQFYQVRSAVAGSGGYAGFAQGAHQLEKQSAAPQSRLSRLRSRLPRPFRPKAKGSVKEQVLTKGAAALAGAATGGWGSVAVHALSSAYHALSNPKEFIRQNRKMMEYLAAAGVMLASWLAGIGKLFFTTWGGFVGGLLGGGVAGFLTGNPLAAALGWAGGTMGGYAAFEALGINGTGPAGLLNSIANGGLGDLVDKAVRFVTGAKPASASGATATQATSHFYTRPAGITAIGVTTGSVMVMVAQTTIQTAFIDPLPTIDAQGFFSQYVTIEKRIAPGVKFPDGPQTLTYTITITPKKDYVLTYKSAADVVTIAYNQDPEIKPSPGPANPPASESYAAFNSDLVNNHVGAVITKDNPLVLPSYAFEFTEEYNHANIKNTFTLTFDVADSTGTIRTDEVAMTGEVACFGECPQLASGCWPTNGLITTTPYFAALYTHASVDAVDIGAYAGTPVFTPFDGTGRLFGNNGASGIFPEYGNHGWIYDIAGPDGAQLGLIFGHMREVNPNLSHTNPFPITAGTQLGTIGTTGNSDGNHLHYELRLKDGPAKGSVYDGYSDCIRDGAIDQPCRSNPGVYGSPADGTAPNETLLEQMTPEGDTYLGMPVRTCYEKQY